jgi:beta-phosphoglucomutase-like phosphatase (HAD superfamily)
MDHLQFPVPFSALIFDFDGLIIDSETPLFRIWQEIYVQNGAALTLDMWQHALGTQHGFDPYADLAARSGVTLSRDEWVPRIRDEHWRRCEGQARAARRVRDSRRHGVRAGHRRVRTAAPFWT